VGLFEEASELVAARVLGSGSAAASNTSAALVGAYATLSFGTWFFVNSVFFMCASTSFLMVAHSFAVRYALKNNKLHEIFALASTEPKKRPMVREMLLSGPHLLAIASFICSVAYTLVVLVFWGLVYKTSESAYLLVVGALVLVGATLGVRLCLIDDLYYLYYALYDPKDDKYELTHGMPNGAIRALLGFAIGMLLLDAPLFVSAAEFGSGLGLSPDLEDALLGALDTVLCWVKWFFGPICFLGVGSIVGTIRRGSWIAPEGVDCCFCSLCCCPPKCNPARPCCGITTEYQKSAATAIANGKWSEFKKNRHKRRYVLEALSSGVLLGVVVLIPIYTLAYAGTYSAATTCKAITAVNAEIPTLKSIDLPPSPFRPTNTLPLPRLKPPSSLAICRWK